MNNTINVRIVLLKNKDGSKWEKLTSRRLTHIPRKGEKLIMMKRDFTIEEVHWDLEIFPDAEVVIELREVK